MLNERLYVESVHEPDPREVCVGSEGHVGAVALEGAQAFRVLADERRRGYDHREHLDEDSHGGRKRTRAVMHSAPRE